LKVALKGRETVENLVSMMVPRLAGNWVDLKVAKSADLMDSLSVEYLELKMVK
jgi:hypothetical protein